MIVVLSWKTQSGWQCGRVFPRVSFLIDPFPRRETPLAMARIQNGRRL